MGNWYQLHHVTCGCRKMDVLELRAVLPLKFTVGTANVREHSWITLSAAHIELSSAKLGNNNVSRTKPEGGTNQIGRGRRRRKWNFDTVRSGGQEKIFLAFTLHCIVASAATNCSQSVPDVWSMGVYVMSRLTVCRMKGLAAAAEGNHSIHGASGPYTFLLL